MAHQTLKSGYHQLVERLNRHPQGAAPSELLFKILAMLFSEREAALVSQLPIKPFTAAKAGRIWKMDPSSARRVLEELARRSILLDVERDGETIYTLPPPMAGFFEFSLMRIRSDIDQKLLAELFYRYMNVEEEFIKGLFVAGQTQIGRVFVHEPVLPAESSLTVMDYERASEVIRTATHLGVGTCYCRHKMQHVGRDCDAPKNICLTLNGTAASLVRHGCARGIEAAEGLDLLAEAHARSLVQFGDNVREKVNFLCNCCGCCCEALLAARRFGLMHPVHTTNFLPQIEADRCKGCGKCLTACPVEAVTLVSANDPKKPRRRKAKLDPEICLGCGLCVRACTTKAMSLIPRGERVVTPVNSAHRVVVMAIERGKLQNLIFDNRALFSHRSMAAVLGIILKLPPLKQALARRQLNSRYLENLLSRHPS